MSNEAMVSSLSSACISRIGMLTEYCQLSSEAELSDEDADRLASIYDEAESDILLGFLINEFDRIINQRLGLLDLDEIEGYKNQQSWLREHLDDMPLGSEYRRDMQEILSGLNYYQGPIDGVIGKRSGKAMEELYRQVQIFLAGKGLYRRDIDGFFGNHSVDAVKKFQELESIKKDGVLGKETISKFSNALHS